MVSWICPNLPFRGSMLRNVQCTPCKIRTIICGNVLCESVKLTEPPDAEPHVRWCDRSAAKAVSYSILWKIKRNILSGFYTDPLVKRVANRLAPFCAFLSFYTDPLVRRVSEVVQTASQIEGNGLVKSAIFGVGCSITLSL